jgi:glycosyltransferase involved in cell wall biosynthesis
MAKRFVYPEYSFQPGLHDKTLQVAAGVISNVQPKLLIGSTSTLYPIPVVAKLSAQFHLPWIADLADIDEQWAPADKRLPWRLSLRRHRFRLRRDTLIRRADAVTTVAKWHKEFLTRFNPSSHVVYNGYDPQVFQPTDSVDSRKFRIVYTGTLFDQKDEDPSLLFSACQRLLNNGDVEADSLVIEFYTQPAIRDAIMRLARQCGVDTVVECHGFMPVAEVPRILNRSALLLLLCNKGVKGHTRLTKFYDYLAVKRPILCVRSDEAELEEAIRSLGAGCCARNLDEAISYLREAYCEWEATGTVKWRGSAERIGEFSGREQSRRLAELFDEVLERWSMCRHRQLLGQ